MFKQISRKLRSRSGASMLLAMVFMLFCVFVGSTVLAASTANSYRVAHLSDQQEYLDQRSAALLLRSQLDNGKLEMDILDITIEKQYGYINNAGVLVPNGETATEKSILFSASSSAPGGLTALQRLALESAVFTYMETNYPAGSVLPLVTLEGFSYTNGTSIDDPSLLSSLWTETGSGEISINGTIDRESFASFDATYLCSSDYDFLVNFSGNSQMTVTLPSKYPAPESTVYDEIGRDDIGDYQANVSYIDSHIGWTDPVIAKGGTA